MEPKFFLGRAKEGFADEEPNCDDWSFLSQAETGRVSFPFFPFILEWPGRPKRLLIPFIGQSIHIEQPKESACDRLREKR